MLFREPYRMYCKMTRAYYVLTNPLGKKSISTIVGMVPFCGRKTDPFYLAGQLFDQSISTDEIRKSGLFRRH